MAAKSATIYYGGFRRGAGGAFVHATEFAEELRRRDWRVRVVTLDSLPRWCRYLPHLVQKAVNLVRMPIGYAMKGAVTRRLYRHYFDQPVDLRVFEDIYLGWQNRDASITFLHATWSDDLQAAGAIDERQASRLKHVEVALIRCTKHPVVTVSWPHREFLMTSYFGGRLDTLGVIENGIDTSAFPPLGTRVRGDPKSLVVTGSLEARKNVGFLLEVFAVLHAKDPAYSLTVVGDGPERAALEARARRSGLYVAFLGRLGTAHDVLDELARHGTYVHASLQEHFSYSLLEAKLAGLATVAYKGLQVPPEFIDVAIPSFEVDAWCKGIEQATTVSSRFRASDYTAHRMVDETLRIAAAPGQPGPSTD